MFYYSRCRTIQFSLRTGDICCFNCNRKLHKKIATAIKIQFFKNHVVGSANLSFVKEEKRSKKNLKLLQAEGAADASALGLKIHTPFLFFVCVLVKSRP